jgi:hypothetical protein
MRKLFGFVAAGLLVLGASGQAHAAALNFTGNIAIQLATLPPIGIPGAGVATVNDSAGGAHLNSLALAGGTFMSTGFTLTISPPAGGAIAGIQVTAMNAEGNFTGGSAVGTLGGQMSIVGFAKVCLFFTCGAPPPANLNVPLDVVGVGGAAAVGAAVNVTVIGAPWTTGTAAVGTVTVMGFAHGPSSETSTTAAPSGVVQLVTPIFVSTSVAGSEVVPAFGIMALHFVPEPGTLVLLGSGIAGLLMFGRSRRS